MVERRNISVTNKINQSNLRKHTTEIVICHPRLILTFLCTSLSSSTLRFKQQSAKLGSIKKSMQPSNIFKCPAQPQNFRSAKTQPLKPINVRKIIKGETTSLVRVPPNKISIESDTPVESRRKTVLTLNFSAKTNHGQGIV